MRWLREKSLEISFVFMIKFKGYREYNLKRMTNEEILSLIGKNTSITVYGEVEVFKDKKTGEKKFICSKLMPYIFPSYFFDPYRATTKKLKLYFIDVDSYEYFKQLRGVKKELPQGNYERVWYNGNPVIAKIYD